MNTHFREFSDSLKIQGRVLYALLMREIITRYGRHNIGFAWLFAEPMLFSIGVVILWNVAHNEGTSHHISAIAYSLTGYSTILVWRNTIGRCVMAVEPNASLLYHRNVRVIDFFLARILLELLGTTMSMIILFIFFMSIGLIPLPHDVMSMLIGWVLLCWYAAAMGLLVGGLVEFSEVVERLWHPIAYFQLPVSGALVMAAWLPESARNIVQKFPVANCVELFRHGYYGNEIRTYYDITYVVLCNLVLTCLGLFVVSAAARRVEPE
ncbi:ABC transporter permease [Burkholderia sp. 3C]